VFHDGEEPMDLAMDLADRIVRSSLSKTRAGHFIAASITKAGTL
jgi:hypothetical protein